MRRIQLGLMAVSVCALVSLLGCGVVDRDEEALARRQPGKGGGAGPAVEIAKLKPVAGKYEGVITGSVKWVGEKPNLASMTEKLQSSMQQDRGICLSGQEFEKSQQAYRIGGNGNLGNVYVWIAPPSGHAFDVPDSQLPANKEVVVSQPHCAFLPHCSAVFASRYRSGKQDPTGCQVLVVRNDARVAHNANVKGGPLNTFNNELIPGWNGMGEPARRTYPVKPQSSALTVSCGIHGWMLGYVWAYDHPYFAVSSVGSDLTDLKKPVWEKLDDPKVGTFELKGVPIGAKVKLFAWHPDLGHLLGPSGKEIELKDKQEETIEAKMK